MVSVSLVGRFRRGQRKEDFGLDIRKSSLTGKSEAMSGEEGDLRHWGVQGQVRRKSNVGLAAPTLQRGGLSSPQCQPSPVFHGLYFQVTRTSAGKQPSRSQTFGVS